MKKDKFAIGKRKKSVARAVIKKGCGIIRINKKPLNLIEPRYRRMRIEEAVSIAGKAADSVDIDVTVNGGGTWGQADASRTAIANALVNWTKDKKLKSMYMNYDRTLMIADARRTEPHKPSRSTAGPRRSKQQSKR